MVYALSGYTYMYLIYVNDNEHLRRFAFCFLLYIHPSPLMVYDNNLESACTNESRLLPTGLLLLGGLPLILDILHLDSPFDASLPLPPGEPTILTIERRDNNSGPLGSTADFSIRFAKHVPGFDLQSHIRSPDSSLLRIFRPARLDTRNGIHVQLSPGRCIAWCR